MVTRTDTLVKLLLIEELIRLSESSGRGRRRVRVSSEYVEAFQAGARAAIAHGEAQGTIGWQLFLSGRPDAPVRSSWSDAATDAVERGVGVWAGPMTLRLSPRAMIMKRSLPTHQ